MGSQYRLAAIAVLAIGLGLRSAGAEPGISDTKIIFGQAAVLEGPAAALGRGMRAGLLAAFGEANAKGGVAGRRLELLSRDDGYEPEPSVIATKRLIEEDHVFALAGAVGTPSAMAAEPIATEAGVPFLGAFTGAEFLRHPFKPNVVNVRASYFEETEFMVEHLTKDRGITRIGLLYQDDSFGNAGLTGLSQALEKRGLKLVAEGTFERNTRAVKTALMTIRKANPEAVILIGPYGPCAEFIRLARQLHFAPVFVASSFAGLDALARELGPAAAGVFITQVVPSPNALSLPIIARYRVALAKLDPTLSPDAVSLEGYIVGRLIVAALQAAGAEPTRKSFLAAIVGHSFDLGGVTLTYLAQDNRGVAQVSLAVIGSDGKGKPVAGMAQAIE